MSVAQKLSYFLIPYAFAFVLAYLIPSFIHRREFDQAVMAYYKNPTPENESAQRVRQRKNEFIHLEGSALGALVLVTLGYGVYGVVRLARNGLKRTRASNSQS
jgi:hypothetical protein